MQLDPDIIIEAIDTYFRKQDGHSHLTLEQKTEYFTQVQEVSEFMNYPGNRDLLIAHLVYLATHNQVIRNS